MHLNAQICYYGEKKLDNLENKNYTVLLKIASCLFIGYPVNK